MGEKYEDGYKMNIKFRNFFSSRETIRFQRSTVFREVM
jgi:hypothetical protein